MRIPRGAVGRRSNFMRKELDPKKRTNSKLFFFEAESPAERQSRPADSGGAGFVSRGRKCKDC